MTSPRVVECPCCGGEGRLYEAYCDWQHGPGEIDVGRCEECEGRGDVVIEAEPIDLSDLENAHEAEAA
jgi:hypothetical protein